MTTINPGDQLFINNKWYFDVQSIDNESIKVRIKYYEGSNKSYYLYKVIKLPITLFNNNERVSIIIKCNVIEKELKRQIGGLIDRLVIESDITRFVEDMGAVPSPGLSGISGVTGSAGSGDVSSILPKKSLGFEIVPTMTRKAMKKLAKTGKNNFNGIKTPLLNLFKEATENDINFSDNDYKLSVYNFLDYPTDNDWDIKFIDIINEWRPSFLDTSSDRIKKYFAELYKTNKALILNKCSEWFQNNIIILADISEND